MNIEYWNALADIIQAELLGINYDRTHDIECGQFKYSDKDYNFIIPKPLADRIIYLNDLVVINYKDITK